MLNQQFKQWFDKDILKNTRKNINFIKEDLSHSIPCCDHIKRKNKILVITSGRTGSKFFADWLRNDLDLWYCDFRKYKIPFGYEPFKWAGDYSRFFDTAQNKQRFVIKHIAHHFENMTKDQIKTLKNLETYNVVLLRKNIFETALSHSLAFKFKNWTKLKDVSTEVDWNDVKFWIDHTCQNYADILDKIYGFDYKDIVYYEDLVFGKSTVWKNESKANAVTNYKHLEEKSNKYIYNEHRRFTAFSRNKK